MTTTNLLTVLAIFIAILLSSCAHSPPEIETHEGSESDHPHLYSNSRNAGDFHVKNFMDRRTGTIGIQVLDRWEDPLYISPKTIRAKIELKDASKFDVKLVGEGWGPKIYGVEEYGAQEGATLFTTRAPWVKAAHSAKLSIWVPLPDGKTHHLVLHCQAREAASGHSGLR